MKRPHIRFATALAGLAMTASIALPGAAQASTKGRRNTAILLGAGTAYELLHHKTTNGLVLGAGTAYAIKKYNDSRKNDHRRRYYYTRTTRRYHTRIRRR